MVNKKKLKLGGVSGFFISTTIEAVDFLFDSYEVNNFCCNVFKIEDGPLYVIEL